MAHASPSAQHRGAQLAQLVYSSLLASARLATVPTVAELEGFLAAGDAITPETTRAAEHARLEMARGVPLGRALERARARTLWERGDRMCAWCEQPIPTLAGAEELGLAIVHHSCAVEFGEWANEDEEAAAEREHGAGARQALAEVLAGVPMDASDEEDF